jgi:hypothetical protein
MAWRCSGETNAELIDNLYKNGLITSTRVREAMMKVGFGDFLSFNLHPSRAIKSRTSFSIALQFNICMVSNAKSQEMSRYTG